MEERKWENLNSDCLANVFGRLDLETRLLGVPLVCKDWYQAFLNPLCWQKLEFPMYSEKLYDNSGVITCGLIKFVADRSKGSATTLVLPFDLDEEQFICFSDVCPSLKSLAISNTDHPKSFISEFIVKCKSLEVLKLDSIYNTDKYIIDQIGLYCKNFAELSITNEHIDEDVASAISELVTIKRLVLDDTRFEKDDLVRILRECKGLELLYVRECIGFDENDEEILKLASGIKDFRCEGSIEIYDPKVHANLDFGYFAYYDDYED